LSQIRHGFSPVVLNDSCSIPWKEFSGCTFRPAENTVQYRLGNRHANFNLLISITLVRATERVAVANKTKAANLSQTGQADGDRTGRMGDGTKFARLWAQQEAQRGT
jgi:hypothetical protein